MDEESKKRASFYHQFLQFQCLWERVLQTMQAREVRIVMLLQKITGNVMWLSFQKGSSISSGRLLKKGAEQAADEYKVNITFVGPETEAQVDKQVEMLRSTLDKKPDAIGFAALDSKAALPLLEQAKNKKIPVVAFDSGVEGDIPVATAATDNKAAAALAAEKMAGLIGEKRRSSSSCSRPDK